MGHRTFWLLFALIPVWLGCSRAGSSNLDLSTFDLRYSAPSYSTHSQQRSSATNFHKRVLVNGVNGESWRRHIFTESVAHHRILLLALDEAVVKTEGFVNQQVVFRRTKWRF